MTSGRSEPSSLWIQIFERPVAAGYVRELTDVRRPCGHQLVAFAGHQSNDLSVGEADLCDVDIGADFLVENPLAVRGNCREMLRGGRRGQPAKAGSGGIGDPEVLRFAEVCRKGNQDMTAIRKPGKHRRKSVLRDGGQHLARISLVRSVGQQPPLLQAVIHEQQQLVAVRGEVHAGSIDVRPGFELVGWIRLERRTQGRGDVDSIESVGIRFIDRQRVAVRRNVAGKCIEGHQQLRIAADRRDRVNSKVRPGLGRVPAAEENTAAIRRPTIEAFNADGRELDRHLRVEITHEYLVGAVYLAQIGRCLTVAGPDRVSLSLGGNRKGGEHIVRRVEHPNDGRGTTGIPGR